MDQRDEFAASSLSVRQVASSAAQTNPSHHLFIYYCRKAQFGLLLTSAQRRRRLNVRNHQQPAPESGTRPGT
jgi:hypothetical protein